MRAGGVFAVTFGALVLAMRTESAPDSAYLTWQKALALYKQKKYDAACPLFESAAKAKPQNGAIWGDLGLCELKRGHVVASVHASRLAVRFGNDKVREAAYHNLGLASASVELPPSGCITILSTPESGCSKAAFACMASWLQHGTGMGSDGTTLFLDDRHEQVQENARLVDGMYGDPGDPPDALAFSREWRCFSWCARHPEYKCVDDCEEGPLRSCSLVFVDACERRAGYVCTEWEEVNGKKRAFAGELAFPEIPAN
jgi:hypothetical protein